MHPPPRAPARWRAAPPRGRRGAVSRRLRNWRRAGAPRLQAARPGAKLYTHVRVREKSAAPAAPSGAWGRQAARGVSGTVQGAAARVVCKPRPPRAQPVSNPRVPESQGMRSAPRKGVARLARIARHEGCQNVNTP